MNILFFGRLKDIARGRTFAPPVHLRTLGELRDWLAASDDLLGDALRAKGVKIALNQEIADPSRAYSPSDEIAFMSPLSGG
ncbi:MAG: MoaD/ThiS family protein [Hyphomonadaceae bacterium]|nr:MoaD/ThiS family protein [Hyphomonadaceae bacterium]